MRSMARASHPGNGIPSMTTVASMRASRGRSDTSNNTTASLSLPSPVTRATLSLEPSPRRVSSSVGRRPGTNGAMRHCTAPPYRGTPSSLVTKRHAGS